MRWRRQSRTGSNEPREPKTAALSAALVLAALSSASTLGAATFAHRTAVTIDRTQVPGVASLSDFPVLISLASNSLRTTAHGGFVTSSEGYDIIFQG